MHHDCFKITDHLPQPSSITINHHRYAIRSTLYLSIPLLEALPQYLRTSSIITHLKGARLCFSFHIQIFQSARKDELKSKAVLSSNLNYLGFQVELDMPIDEEFRFAHYLGHIIDDRIRIRWKTISQSQNITIPSHSTRDHHDGDSKACP